MGATHATSRALVERDHELTLLTGLVSKARSGRGGSARILGQAGVGKTTLIRTLQDSAAAMGARTWSTSAGQLETQLPFGVVRRLLDRPVRDLSADERGALDASPARLALTHLWCREIERVDAPAQGDMLHSLGWLLEELADEPVLLTIDDAQWADEESLLFLGSLRERLTDLPIAVVIAARDESVDRSPTLSALVADRDAVVLRLKPLSGDGISVLLNEHWSDVAAGTASAVLDVTGGNPFLVHALADALGDGVDVGPDRVRAAVPDSVVDLMVARLSGLPEDQQALTQAIAILDSSPLASAAALAGLDHATATAAADHLRRVGLLGAGAGLSFRHTLLRTAAYSLIGTDTRDAQHRAAAVLLATDTQRAAAHLLMTTGVGDAWSVDVLRNAASDALAVGAPLSAVPLLKRALAEPPADNQLADILGDLGLAQMRTFDPECLGTLTQSLSLTTDPQMRMPRALLLAATCAFAGLHETGAAVLDDLLNEMGNADADALLMVTAAWSAITLLIPARVPETRQRLAGLPALDGTTAAERLVIMQQLYIAVCSNQPAEVIGALADRVIGDWGTPEQFPESGDWVWPRLFLGRIGHYETVRALTDVGIEHAQSTGSVVGMIAAHFVRALTEYDAGDLAAAELHYQAMVTHHDGGLLIQMLGHAGLAETFTRQGRIEEARAILTRFPDDLPPGTPSTGAALVWDARASVAQAVGDHSGALQAAEGLRVLLHELDADSPTWVCWRPLAIEPLRSLGRLEEARSLAQEHLDLCRASEVPHLIGEALRLLATVTVDVDEAIAIARESVAALSSSGSRWRAGTSSLTLGSLLRRSGGKAEARDHLREAMEVLTECGAIPAAEFARAELAATGLRLTRSNPRVLTPSERRVAELVLNGMGNREIAAHLHVTRKTVETHLSAVYRKAEITRREDLRPEHLA